MSPREVQGLQALAMKHGGSLTINPDTGLPEAGFLDKLLPAIIGFAVTAATGLPAWQVGLGVGAVETARTGDLGKGIQAGLGAYGGAGIAMPGEVNQFSLQNQIKKYLEDHHDQLKPDSLYVIWMGANNYFNLPDDQDAVVKVSAMQKMLEEISTPATLKKQVPMPLTENHVLGSPIKSKDVAGVIRETEKFLVDVMGMKVKQ
jgi:hypothetical protein